ncbi:benzoate/H(+) symporter BenE family transporter, partial [Salmonella enterica subsp. enterica serovar Montevideo]|nr:benzoate/H(+) symporter BenE family transporter [Salmonella enterica subsp. enterica serovar Montevideo]
GSLYQALTHESERDAAVIAFLVTASGLTLMGIGSAFWGLIAGALATRIEAQGFRPYVIPVGGSSALGAMGYVESALEIAQQCEEV